jgi:hypothetical protein
VAYNLRVDLDQLLAQAGPRPGLRRSGHCQRNWRCWIAPRGPSRFSYASPKLRFGSNDSVPRREREGLKPALPHRSPGLQRRTGVHPQGSLSSHAGNGSSCP